jgi:isoquinoline 1-oxidoreductase subunit alpha
MPWSAVWIRLIAAGVTKLSLNNETVAIDLDPETPLLWAIRDAANLTGTKYGCGTGDCGACTVDVDGRAVLSCQTKLGSVEGAIVTTIEGLSRDRSHPVQQAWAAQNVVQCGFCQPGMIMAVASLLKTNTNPSDEEINLAITNLCRCGTTPRVRAAIRRAARVMMGQEIIAATPPPGIHPEDAARAVPAMQVRKGE